MNRFFLPPEGIQADKVIFPGEFSHQIARVLRLKLGDFVTILDNAGYEYLVELTAIDGHEVSGAVRERRPASGEPPVYLVLYLCLTQREKFEWALQKCTEIGVAELVPVISSRSLVQDQAGTGQKLERWQRIIREAAEQSGRGRLPVVSQPLRLAAALQYAVQANHRNLLAWEMEGAQGLTAVLGNITIGDRLGLLIGPEGGLSGDEVQTARELGWQVFSLGRRILRMETAAIVAAARIVAAYEDNRD